MLPRLCLIFLVILIKKIDTVALSYSGQPMGFPTAGADIKRAERLMVDI